MIPSTFVELSTMPLTSGGKIDRRTLTERTCIYPEDSLPEARIASRDQNEQRLVQIWEEVLGHNGIGIRDSFFDLGGNSLLALRLMAKIQQHFTVNLPLATLFHSPTIEELAPRLTPSLSSIKKADWSALVPIQPDGDKPPFFCVPGVGGNVLYLYDLARFMGTEQPFYGLQSIGLDGKTPPYTTVEAIAAHYVEVILSVQMEGPYFLGGHSFGGMVAFEMAQQLHKAGHDIACLMIFDMSAPTPRTEFEKATWNDAKWLLSLGKSIGIWTDEKTEGIEEKLLLLEPEEQLLYFKDKLEELNFLPMKSNLNQIRGWLQVYKTNSLMNYVPDAVTPIPITLFRAEEQGESNQTELQKASFDSPTWGWNHFSKEPTSVIFVPGNHITMMRPPHIQVLANQLREFMKNTLSKIK
jgi:thioesterase domain-containing protein/acyl carrier protein